MIVEETKRFKKEVKKLNKNQKSDLYVAIRHVISNPDVGDIKKGDIAGIQVYKFKMAKQETLLAYLYDGHNIILTLLSVGSHQNFYDNLKKTVNK